MKKLVDIDLFNDSLFRNALGKIVFVKGVFDLTHAGHIMLFEKAKRLGDTLVVALATDDFVKAKKGINRPILDFKSRSIILSSIEYIDFIVAYDDIFKVLKLVQPTMFCASHFDSLTTEEKGYLSARGVEFWSIEKPKDVLSTTELINKIRGL